MSANRVSRVSRMSGRVLGILCMGAAALAVTTGCDDVEFALGYDYGYYDYGYGYDYAGEGGYTGAEALSTYLGNFIEY